MNKSKQQVQCVSVLFVWLLRMKNVCGVNNTFYKHDIIFYITCVSEYGQLCEPWHIVRNVAVGQGALEGRVVTIRLEAIPDVFPVSLVNQDNGDLAVKGPLQKRVVLPLHENETQLEASSITIQAGFNTHLVASVRC